MMRSKSVIVVVLMFSLALWAATKGPLSDFYEQQYKAFPAESTKAGPKPKLQWLSDPWSTKYKTGISEEWSTATAPNFADHYFVTQNIGCGVACRVMFIIDWNSGKMVHAPIEDVFEVRKESRLIIFKPYEDCSAYGPPILYEFTDSKFREIKHDQCQKK